jgi:NADH-quinone oxidoreductase subunit J
MDWISQHWMIVLALVLSAIGVWWLMPRAEMRSRPVGFLFAFSGIGLLASRFHLAAGPHTEGILFVVFATMALLCAVLMITSRNPVYSALWFALVTLSVCGLFLLQSAPFLAAATIVVYAGAIVVTFLFVIMLAQQSGSTIYDQRSRQPMVATLAAFIVLGALLSTFEPWHEAQLIDPQAAAALINSNPLSRPAAAEPLGTMHGLGRSLFGDYLFAVELAGTLLLIATIGAVIMAPRRSKGTL